MRRGGWSALCIHEAMMSPFTHPRLRRNRRGVTLVELMVVIAMVGILSAIAIAGVRHYTGKVINQEAPAIIASIKAAQEMYRNQMSEYLNVSSSLGACFPFNDPEQLGSVAVQWGDDNANDLANWNLLGVEVNGPVRFCYSVVAGAAGETPPSLSAECPFPYVLPSAPNSPWYVIQATGDPNNSGRYTCYASSSFGEWVHHIAEDGFSVNSL
jgi:type IV pilus assembly protein PilA